MEDDGTWSFGLSTSSRSYRSALKSLSDLCVEFEEMEIEGDDDLRADYPCPFCAEDFDLVELCYHIDDEHPFEPKSGEGLQLQVCPVCAESVRMNIVGHITTQHGDMFKSLQKLKQKSESHPSLSFLKKEIEDGYLRALLSGSSSVTSSPKLAPDPFMSFLYNVPSADKPEILEPDCSTELTLEEQSSNEKASERSIHPSPMSDREYTEKANRSDFVQGLLLSTILDDSL